MQPGSLVKCIHDYSKSPSLRKWIMAFNALGLVVKWPVKDSEYIVREIIEKRNEAGKLFIGLRLEELDNSHLASYFPPPKGVGEPAFCITSFVELQPPMELDIEELLKQSNSMPINEMAF